MKITHTVIILFIGSFIIQYLLLPLIMVNKTSYLTNSIGKAYLATIAGISMILLEIAMHDYQYSVLSVRWYAGLVSSLALFVYLYRTQLAINDKQYLQGLIERASMDIFTSESILKKTDDYNIAKLAKNVISEHNDRLQTMQELVAK
jgi:hypothetical protein